MFNTEEELKKLPKSPGVYIMHGEKDEVIYVGKAKNLHNRVRSYFRKIVGRGPAIDRMVSQISRFEYIVTDTELEALVLENNLIKEYEPKYNTMLRDDKTYPYIKVTVNEDFPRILFVRRLKKDHSRVFGPYSSSYAVRDTIELLNKIYGLRTCSMKLPEAAGKTRPCLNYHMKQCCGPCTGHVSKEEYRKRVDSALAFLDGRYESVISDLEERMNAASEKLEFEEAARLRDLISNVKSILQRQKITGYNEEDRDVIALARGDSDAVVQIFFIRSGKMIGRDHFYMTHVTDTDDDEVMYGFLRQYYAGTPYIPQEIMLSSRVPDAELIEEWLSGRKGRRVHILVPERGSKEKLLELAKENARLVLTKDSERIRLENARTVGAVRQISELLGLPQIHRMEAFDISNISGFLNVGSMVVFEDGRPKKSDYRKFRIKTVAGPDDYACMKEVLTRRFEHGLAEKETSGSGFSVFPDILLMDGGRGQVNIATGVLKELGLDIPVAGMVKDDFHRTRGIYWNNEEIPIDTHSEGFKLITRVQDEAHRFAIEYHRSLRSKNQVQSVLDQIPGVGEARRKALMRRYSSLSEIKEASAEDIAKTPGIPASVAEEIRNYLNGKDQFSSGS
ncbi:MAG: excinuclease ABC subunit UvrC [Lachnospiraceae bacterium]|nr:excinuclease ABC subunit UvrC [Lachnospiraceae bacterium]